MTQPEESRLAERQIAFLRQLPRRTEVIGRRMKRFMREGWDINGLALIHEDATRLARSCERQGLTQAQGSLGSMSMLLSETLERQELPDPSLAERLQHLVEDIQHSMPAPSDTGHEPMPAHQQGQARRAETPPHGYWRRWGDDAPPAVMVSVAAAIAAPPPPAPKNEPDPWSPKAIHFGSLSSSGASFGRTEVVETTTTTAKPSPAPAQVQPPAETAAVAAQAPATRGKGLKPGLRIYHLSDSGEISVALDQLLESLGMEIELLDDTEELKELLGALPADLVLVDSAFSGQLEPIGDVVRQARLKTSQRVMLAAICRDDDIALKLSARRAGVDSLILGPESADDVLQRLRQLYEGGKEAPYRILIVEDDRSQALFAEGILRNAGMESRVVLDAMQVLPALEEFQPEMILMDLHMPGASGIELTALIREQEAFLHTPIVFLSGEHDADQQFDAIDAGGDDFLSKPIRPRHLIAAVQGRVRRHRAMGNRLKPQETGRNPATGLHHRSDLIESLNRILADKNRKAGGVLFFEIESLNLLRERLGLSLLEQVLGEFARLLSDKARDLPVARFGDGAYFLLDEAGDEAALDSLALHLRSTLVQNPFQVQGQPLRLRVSVGVCSLAHRFADSGALLNAVERVAREARTLERGVKRYAPASSSDGAREAAMVADIREALVRRRFELVYQPVVAVAGSDDSQYQVLLRMPDASGKMRSAADVIPVAERTGAILDIDRWVISESLELIRQRDAEGRSLRLFVTQSSITLADAGHAAWLRGMLSRHKVQGSSLVIEMRLADIAMNAGTVRQFCDQLIADGVQFCLSQFEAGPEADSLIELLPLAFVKLAHKYTAGTTNHALRDELRQIIDRAHRRGLEVIGHGVEDAQAAATLWMSGIDFIQGNLVQQADQDLDFDFHQAVL